jgi:hypothetical protein
MMPNFPIVQLEIDSMDAFDYENAENAKYSVDDLRHILIGEIKKFEAKRVLPRVGSTAGARTSKTPS